jgi:hypothetical protein
MLIATHFRVLPRFWLLIGERRGGTQLTNVPALVPVAAGAHGAQLEHGFGAVVVAASAR